MDPLTHCLMGAVAAKAVHADRRRFWIMAFLGMAPDLDVLANYLPGWAQLFQHRGLTHSLLGVLVQPFLFAFLLRAWDNGFFRIRAFHYSLPIFLHVLCDLLTSYGVPLLSPFRQTSYSWNLAGSLNFIPLGLTILGLTWLHRQQRSGWRATAPVWAMWALYLVFIFTGKTYAARLAEASPHPVVLVPSVMNPFSWDGVAASESDYATYVVDLLSGGVRVVGKYSRPGTEQPVQDSLKSPAVQEFVKRSRWPVVRVMKDGLLSRVEWGELVFSVRGLARGHVAAFVTADGHVLRDDNIVTFWNPDLN